MLGHQLNDHRHNEDTGEELQITDMNSSTKD
jgi:hypothetical protein